ncbi:MAG: hypothetical protein EBU90_17290 [Proteobacteria bacterium]|nr:hypothetical protein [Pseudomonadota bacterium]NBP15538.1 hypothetical protein [bacterium]
MPAYVLSDMKTNVPKFEGISLTTSTANVVWNYVSVGANYRINNIQLSNYSASNANAVIGIFDYSNNVIINIANTLVIRNNLTCVSNVLTSFLLESGDVLFSRSDSNNSINIFVQYDIVSDAIQSTVYDKYFSASNNGTLI